MRITIHLDSFDRLDPRAYAILWLDKDTRRWSREGHAGLDLPPWGSWRDVAGNTLICGADDGRVHCILKGLELKEAAGPFEGETGRAQWVGNDSMLDVSGCWHVQCVDRDAIHPEHSVFAADDTV